MTASIAALVDQLVAAAMKHGAADGYNEVAITHLEVQRARMALGTALDRYDIDVSGWMPDPTPPQKTPPARIVTPAAVRRGDLAMLHTTGPDGDWDDGPATVRHEGVVAHVETTGVIAGTPPSAQVWLIGEDDLETRLGGLPADKPIFLRRTVEEAHLAETIAAREREVAFVTEERDRALDEVEHLTRENAQLVEALHASQEQPQNMKAVHL